MLLDIAEIIVHVVTPAHLQMGTKARWILINPWNALGFSQPIESINCKKVRQVR